MARSDQRVGSDQLVRSDQRVRSDQLGCSSLHFLYILLIKDILRSPDNITIFQHRPDIRFIEVNNCGFVKMLEGF